MTSGPVVRCPRGRKKQKHVARQVRRMRQSKYPEISPGLAFLVFNRPPFVLEGRHCGYSATRIDIVEPGHGSMLGDLDGFRYAHNGREAPCTREREKKTRKIIKN
jgi:hypothetical protein